MIILLLVLNPLPLILILFSLTIICSLILVFLCFILRSSLLFDLQIILPFYLDLFNTLSRIRRLIFPIPRFFIAKVIFVIRRIIFVDLCVTSLILKRNSNHYYLLIISAFLHKPFHITTLILRFLLP